MARPCPSGKVLLNVIGEDDTASIHRRTGSLSTGSEGRSRDPPLDTLNKQGAGFLAQWHGCVGLDWVGTVHPQYIPFPQQGSHMDVKPLMHTLPKRVPAALLLYRLTALLLAWFTTLLLNYLTT